MDGWTIAVIVTFALAMTVCLRRNEIAQSIARMINASREEVMLQIMEETRQEKSSWDNWQQSLQHSDDFYHIAEGLKIMATAGRISIAPQHQEIEPYTPPPSDSMELWQIGKDRPIGYLDKFGRVYHAPEPLPRYEIVMVDDWQSGYASDIPPNVDEKAVTPFLRDKTVDG